MPYKRLICRITKKEKNFGSMCERNPDPKRKCRDCANAVMVPTLKKWLGIARQ